VFYLSLGDKPLTYVCGGVQFDRVSHFRDMHLCPCVARCVSVDMSQNFYLSLCDKPLISFDTMRIPAFLVTVFKLLIFVSRSLYCSLYVFLQSDFATCLCLLFHNQFVHAMLMCCVSQEVPGRRVSYIFLLMMRNMILRHDFLVRIRLFFARE
jgi:hypothetical protein